MIRQLSYSPSFLRAMRRLIKHNPVLNPETQDALDRLRDDAFQPSLYTHKLKGDLAGYLACSAGYDFRIVFSIVQKDDGEEIELQSISNHNNAY